MSEVRAERDSDAAAVGNVLRNCFPTEGETRLVELLRTAGRLVVSLVAEADGLVVGHVAFSPVTVERAGATQGVGLGPLAVLATHRRHSIGAELVRAGLESCRAAGYGWCVVLGEPDYYGRFGFRAAAEFGLSDEYGGGPAFQAIELLEGALPQGAGLVRYADEFATVT